MKQILNLLCKGSYWLGFPLLYVLFHSSRRVRIIVMSGSEILLVRNWCGTWQLPGGGVKKGETPKHAAARELKEETGISVPSAKLLRLAGFRPVRERGIPFQFQPFVVRMTDKPNVQNASFEILESKWISLAEAAHMTTLTQSSQQSLQHVEK